MDRKGLILMIAGALLLMAWVIVGAATLPGTYRATITRQVDGDTFSVITQVWTSMYSHDSVRLLGIDTPEKGPLAKCDKEKRLGEMASDFVTRLARVGDEVTLSEVQGDKYNGRVVARVQLLDGRDLASILIHAGLAKAYDGKGPKPDWCKD